MLRRNRMKRRKNKRPRRENKKKGPRRGLKLQSLELAPTMNVVTGSLCWYLAKSYTAKLDSELLLITASKVRKL